MINKLLTNPYFWSSIIVFTPVFVLYHFYRKRTKGYREIKRKENKFEHDGYYYFDRILLPNLDRKNGLDEIYYIYNNTNNIYSLKYIMDNKEYLDCKYKLEKLNKVLNIPGVYVVMSLNVNKNKDYDRDIRHCYVGKCDRMLDNFYYDVLSDDAESNFYDNQCCFNHYNAITNNDLKNDYNNNNNNNNNKDKVLDHRGRTKNELYALKSFLDEFITKKSRNYEQTLIFIPLDKTKFKSLDELYYKTLSFYDYQYNLYPYLKDEFNIKREKLYNKIF